MDHYLTAEPETNKSFLSAAACESCCGEERAGPRPAAPRAPPRARRPPCPPSAQAGPRSSLRVPPPHKHTPRRTVPGVRGRAGIPARAARAPSRGPAGPPTYEGRAGRAGRSAGPPGPWSGWETWRFSGACKAASRVVRLHGRATCSQPPRRIRCGTATARAAACSRGAGVHPSLRVQPRDDGILRVAARSLSGEETREAGPSGDSDDSERLEERGRFPRRGIRHHVRCDPLCLRRVHHAPYRAAVGLARPGPDGPSAPAGPRAATPTGDSGKQRAG